MKGKKQDGFGVFPEVSKDRKPLYRKVVVNWGNGLSYSYTLIHLPVDNIRSFWRLSDVEKIKFLQKEFGIHHRKPRCQKGSYTEDNLSRVDNRSHESYNTIIEIISKWANIKEKDVTTEYIFKFLTNVYKDLQDLFVHPESYRPKGLKAVLDEENICKIRPRLRRNISKCTRLSYGELNNEDICRFLKKIYSPIMRLAIDHDANKFRSFLSFILVLNMVWLPKDEPIIFRSVRRRV